MDELQTNCYNMMKNVECYIINKKPHKLSALCIDESQLDVFKNKSKCEERGEIEELMKDVWKTFNL